MEICQRYKLLRKLMKFSNPIKLKIFDILTKSDKNYSLMELSRIIKTSKTNTEHHIRMMEKIGVLNIRKPRYVQHNYLCISLNRK